MILVVFLFFFKQKTAYEMRISDWSSDVCSSDLPARCPGGIAPTLQGPGRDLQRLRLGDRRRGTLRLRIAPRCAGLSRDRPGRDRKSVVSGKSVSVRVDLGGRRIIKKKKTTKTSTVLNQRLNSITNNTNKN